MSDNKVFLRLCPKCKREILYARKDGLSRAIQQNRSCYQCSRKGELNPYYE